VTRPYARGPLVALLALTLTAIGLFGAYRYWESYYEARGFATVAYLPHARRGHLVTVNFYSPALGREADYLAYLPSGYGQSRRRYPVYYLLHGSPGRPQVFLGIASMPARLDNLISQHRIRPMIMVFPDGRIADSTYSDSEWANTPSGKYESYVIDVVHDVDHRFATLANRRDRVIAGFSAGAYGATNIALHHLGTFAGLQSWSGYYIETRSGVFAHAGHAVLAHNSPLDYVSELRSQFAVDPTRAFLFVGRDDDDSPQTEPMAKALAAAGASVSYALYPGGHDWQLWHAHLDQMLILASRDTSNPLPRRTGTAKTLTPGVVPLPHGRGRRHRHATARAVLSRRRRHHRDRRPRHRRGRLTLAAADLRPPNSQPLRPADGRRRGRGRGRIGPGELIGGLLLALGSAAMINIGFLLQHRGLRRRPGGGPAEMLRAALRNQSWLAGQALGWVGFAAQIVAVAIAPLSLVQAFAAGGLALSVPLAAGIFGQPVTRSQLLAVLLIAGGLAALAVGFSTARDQLTGDALIAAVTIALAAALAISRAAATGAKAVAAGVFYGVADAAIKAVSVGWRVHGSSALLSSWTALAMLTTFGGFLAFQAALAGQGAIAPISLMNAFAALVALGCGLFAFGESLGGGTGVVLAHGLAIAVVLGCVPVLAAAQAAIVEAGHERDQRSAPRAGPLRASQGSG
jgi:enterochelin esterase-like enzyme